MLGGVAIVVCSSDPRIVLTKGPVDVSFARSPATTSGGPSGTTIEIGVSDNGTVASAQKSKGNETTSTFASTSTPLSGGIIHGTREEIAFPHVSSVVITTVVGPDFTAGVVIASSGVGRGRSGLMANLPVAGVVADVSIGAGTEANQLTTTGSGVASRTAIIVTLTPPATSHVKKAKVDKGLITSLTQESKDVEEVYGKVVLEAYKEAKSIGCQKGASTVPVPIPAATTAGPTLSVDSNEGAVNPPDVGVAHDVDGNVAAQGRLVSTIGSFTGQRHPDEVLIRPPSTVASTGTTGGSLEKQTANIPTIGVVDTTLAASATVSVCGTLASTVNIGSDAHASDVVVNVSVGSLGATPVFTSPSAHPGSLPSTFLILGTVIALTFTTGLSVAKSGPLFEATATTPLVVTGAANSPILILGVTTGGSVSVKTERMIRSKPVSKSTAVSLAARVATSIAVRASSQAFNGHFMEIPMTSQRTIRLLLAWRGKFIGRSSFPVFPCLACGRGCPPALVPH